MPLYRDRRCYLNQVNDILLFANDQNLPLLYVTTDFDHTLTTFSSKQCHGYLSSLCSDSFQTAFLKLFELDLSSDLGKWWILCNKLIIDQSGLIPSKFSSINQSGEISLRQGVADLLHLAQTSCINFFICSAGIYNIIKSVIEQDTGFQIGDKGPIYIDANKILFNNCNEISLEPEIPINPTNKHELPLRFPHLFHSFSSGSQPSIVFILGDSDRDFGLILPTDGSVKVIKWGFARDNDAGRALIARAGCDVVFVGDEECSQGIRLIRNACAHILLASERVKKSLAIHDTKPNSSSVLMLSLIPSVSNASDAAPSIFMSKWDNYYINAKATNSSPPWESLDAFQDLQVFFDCLLVARNKSASEISNHCVDENAERLVECSDNDYDVRTALRQDFESNLLLMSPLLNPSSARVIELGCGSSASSIYLARLGYQTVAVDISTFAIERAMSRQHSELVDWVVADVLGDRFLALVGHGLFDFVFDMQCFHVLRDIDEEKAAEVLFQLLRPGGILMLVCGAATHSLGTHENQPSGLNSAINDSTRCLSSAAEASGCSSSDIRPNSTPAASGPPQLTQAEVTAPILKKGFLLLSIHLSQFNDTPFYQSRSTGVPNCWTAVFMKPISIDDLPSCDSLH